MLPKDKRLRDTRDFKRVYQKGSFFSVSTFSINFLPNRSQITRLGVVISKKTEAKATKRNLLKRRFREAAQKLYGTLPSGYDVVITIKEKAKSADFAQIEKELSFAAGKMKEKTSSQKGAGLHRINYSEGNGGSV